LPLFALEESGESGSGILATAPRTDSGESGGSRSIAATRRASSLCLLLSAQAARQLSVEE